MPPGKVRRSPRNAKTALYHPPKPREGPCIIENIPPEILREIYTLIFDNWVVPLALFLVNRRWNEVACGHSLLRSAIHIGTVEEYHHNCTEYGKPIFCTSSSQLARALARIGNSKFSLYITWVAGDIILSNPALENQCRSLHLNIDSLNILPLDLRMLTALEELDIRGSHRPDLQFDIKTLLDELELSASSLKAMRIYGSWPVKVIGGLEQMHLLTDGVTISPEDIGILMEGMKNLELLGWKQTLSVSCPINLVPNSLKTLYLLGVPRIQIQGSRNLVNLTVDYGSCDESYVPADSLLELPLLEILDLRGSWSDLPRIRAPTLNQLSLTEAYENNIYLKGLIPLIQVKAKVLYINSHISDDNFKSLLTNVWSDLELHWMCPEHQILGDSLARGLTGVPKTRPLCPNLKALTVEVYSTEETDPHLFRQCVRRLESIVEGRRNRAYDTLESVRCGWRDIEMFDDDEENSDAVMTWFEVL